MAPQPVEESAEAWAPARVAAYLAEYRVLERVNASVNDAVRNRAPNPLLHIASLLRREDFSAPPDRPSPFPPSERYTEAPPGIPETHSQRVWLHPALQGERPDPAPSNSTSPSTLLSAPSSPSRAPPDGSGGEGVRTEQESAATVEPRGAERVEYSQPPRVDGSFSPSTASTSSAEEARGGSHGGTDGASELHGVLPATRAHRRMEGGLARAGAPAEAEGVSVSRGGAASAAHAHVHVPTMEALAKALGLEGEVSTWEEATACAIETLFCELQESMRCHGAMR
ncbi:hypothetical protein AB1Y20_001456 [Prymnesium parvum]|uniref:Uncharacterized protein n=1 Tax=Prymnesium parvum TaxID=97485 RepID=A0AB34K8R6_PRYPA